MGRLTLISVFLYVAIFGVPVVKGGNFPELEYEESVVKYLGCLENISVIIEETDHTTDGKIGFTGTHTFTAIPGYAKVKSIEAQQGASTPNTPRISWEILRPDGYFSIAEKPNSQFLLKSWHKNITTPLQLDRGSSMHYLTMPVCRGGIPLLDILRGKSAQVVNMKQVLFKSNGPNSCTLMTEDAAQNSIAESRYEFNENWLLTSFRATNKVTKEGVQEVYSYTEFAGKRLPLRITANRFGSDGRLKVPGFEAKFGPYSAFDGSRNDFSLDQFGIPETALYATPGRWASKNWLYLLAAALGFAALSFAMWRRSRRDGPTPAGAH